MENKNTMPLSLGETSHLLAIWLRTVKQLVESGELKLVRIGASLALPPGAPPLRLRALASIRIEGPVHWPCTDTDVLGAESIQ